MRDEELDGCGRMLSANQAMIHIANPRDMARRKSGTEKKKVRGEGKREEERGCGFGIGAFSR